MEKKVQIDFSEGEGVDKVDYKGIVVMKKLNFDERNILDEESTEIKVYGETVQTKPLPSRMKLLGVLKSVAKSDLIKTTYTADANDASKLTPVNVKIDLQNVGEVQNLPVEIGEILFNEFVTMNQVNRKKE